MIDEIEIANFKVFKDEKFHLSPLTLFMGENGAGKSSVSQALLLLLQSEREGKIEALRLNGPYCEIGSGADALRQKANIEEFKFIVRYEKKERELKFSYEAKTDQQPIIGDPVNGIFSDSGIRLRFLSANRIGPRLISPLSQTMAEDAEIDGDGESTLAVLHSHGERTLSENDPRLIIEAKTKSIIGTTNHYLSRISKGASIDVEGLSKIDSVIGTYNYLGGKGQLPTENLRPTNVGFGLSYALSIIVNCLVAEPGEILIIENPEAHLHTKAQRAIAELMAKTAKAGVQIICETHSREIFYWLRRFVSDKPNYQHQIRLNYVRRNAKEQFSHVNSLFPLNSRTTKLAEAKEVFEDDFGKPADFIDSIG